MTSVRRMHADEGPALLALFRDTIRRVNASDYTPEQVAAWSSDDIDETAWCAKFDGHPVFVAEVDGELAGFGDLEEDGHVNRFFVSADHQRRGVGQALVDAILAEAAERGLERLHSEISITARPFFERQGFVVIEEETVSFRGAEFLRYRMERPIE